MSLHLPDEVLISLTVVTVVLWAVARGLLVPNRVLEEAKADRDQWRLAARAVDEETRELAVLLETLQHRRADIRQTHGNRLLDVTSVQYANHRIDYSGQQRVMDDLRRAQASNHFFQPTFDVSQAMEALDEPEPHTDAGPHEHEWVPVELVTGEVVNHICSNPLCMIDKPKGT